jgi:hypothetical protein
MLVENGITKLFASRRDAMLVKFTSGIDSNFYQHIVPLGTSVFEGHCFYQYFVPTGQTNIHRDQTALQNTK